MVTGLIVECIGVVGAGLMGAGIAQAAASGGIQVVLYDVSTDAVGRAIAAITKRIDSDVNKGRLTQNTADDLLTRIRPARSIHDFADLSYVVEAATERMDVKKEIFLDLDAVTNPDAVLATNTSGLSVTEIASVTKRPEQVIGTHFFNPVPVMKLVEIVRGSETSEDTVAKAKTVCEGMGKTVIEVADAPLFVVNRILVPMMNEAIFVLQEGLADKEAIDTGMRLGANHPIGPLALCDMVGLDTLLLVAETLFTETGDPKYRPAPLLRQMVRAGRLGKKSGRGFYDYVKS